MNISSMYDVMEDIEAREEAAEWMIVVIVITSGRA